MEPGSVVGGRYRLETLLGEGGMASVWGAIDETLDRPVALKFIYAEDPRRRERMAKNFLHEARLAAAIRHRNVVQTLDFGTLDDGTPYMVMERLDGQDLGKRLARGPMELNELVDIICNALEGLAAVHEAGIVHRDVKPENIFLVDERTGVYPKLLDFGISRSLDVQSGRRSAIPTQQGRVVGTPHYMAPEQAMGVPDLDGRADLYSVGVVLYEALTGRLPYVSDNVAEVLLLVVQLGQAPDVIELNPEVGQAVSDVVKRAMIRDRDQRFANAAEMQSALLQAAKGVSGAQTRRLGAEAQPQIKDPRGAMETVDALPKAGRRSPGPPRDATSPPASSPGAAAVGSVSPSTAYPIASMSPAAASPAAQATAAISASAVSQASMPPADWTGSVSSMPPVVVQPASRVWVWGLLGALVVAGLGGAAYAIWFAQSSADRGPRYIVVKGSETGSGSSAPADPPSPMPSSPEPSEQEGGEAVELSPAPEPPAARAQRRAAKPPRTRHAKSSVASAAVERETQLARAFADQTPKLVECFQSTDEHTPRVRMRFQIDEAGRVQHAQVLPVSLGQTEVGRCLVRIARTTQFGPQPAPLAFTVPLVVRRQ